MTGLSDGDIEIIGFVGGYVVAISSPFQLAKCLRTWKTRDVSLMWILNYLSGLLLIFVYGLLMKLPAIWVPIILEITCSTGIFVLKVYIEFIEGVVYAKDVACQTADEDIPSKDEKILYARSIKEDENDDSNLVVAEMKMIA